MIKRNCYNHFRAHLISATLPTMCEDNRDPYLCQLYPQTCLASGICLTSIGPRMLEYGILLYRDGGKNYDKKKRPGDGHGASQAPQRCFFLTQLKKKERNVGTSHDYMGGRPDSKLMSHSLPSMGTKRYMFCAPNSLAYSSGSPVDIAFEKRVELGQMCPSRRGPGRHDQNRLL